jgi:hypothetical protein
MYDELEDLLRGDDGTTDRFFHRVAELYADIDDAAAVVGVERKECDDAGDRMEVSVMRAMLSVRRVRACVPLLNIVGITVTLFTCPPDRGTFYLHRVITSSRHFIVCTTMTLHFVTNVCNPTYLSARHTRHTFAGGSNFGRSAGA